MSHRNIAMPSNTEAIVISSPESKRPPDAWRRRRSHNAVPRRLGVFCYVESTIAEAPLSSRF